MVKKTSLSIILIILLGVGLRLIALNQSFWLDEAAQAEMSVKSLSFIWFGRGGDFHPPLFYILAHFWLGFSHSEIWARVLPVLFGSLTIWVMYLLAGQLLPQHKVKVFFFDLSTAQIAALLLAINPYHIYYSQEFRAYSLLALLGSLSMYLFLKKKFQCLTFINILLLYTHYSAFYVLLTQLLITFIYYRPRFLHFLLSLLITAVAFLPWFPQFTSQLNSGLNITSTLPGWEQMLSTSTYKAIPTILFKFVAGRITFINRNLYAVYAVFVFAVLGLAFILARFNLKLLHAWLFIPILAMLGVSYFAPQNQPFRIIFCLIPLLLIITQACLRYPKIMLTLLLYISLVGNVTYFSRPRLQREQWREAVEFLSTRQSLVLVKFPGAFAPLTWYGPTLPVIPLTPHLPLDQTETSQIIASFPPVSNVFLLDYLSDITDPARHIDRMLLDAGFEPGVISDFSGVGFIQEYSRF